MQSRFTHCGAIALCLMLAPVAARSAEAPPPKPDPVDVQKSVERGLAWLAAQSEKKAEPGESPYQNDVAIASLAGLAFLASGGEPDKGEYGKPLRTILDFVLAAQKDSGLLSAEKRQGPMYGHGYGTLFLAEVCLRQKNEPAKAALQKAVNLIESAQSKEGGWRYMPTPLDADISVTACEMNALLDAKAAGSNVDEKVIRNGVDFVRRCQNHDGGFAYMAAQMGFNSSGFPRSAAGVAVLVHSGAKPTDADVKKGVTYVSGYFPNRNLKPEGHFYYGYYYASQWLPAANPAAHDAMVGELLAAQQKGGSWLGDFSETYATANALIVLQAPQRRLWIQR